MKVVKQRGAYTFEEDESGRTTKIMKSGEVIWNIENLVSRDKISDESLEVLRKNASSKFEKILFEVLTGEKADGGN